ncbi:MnhB domain-containing protein [Pseudofrankia inefficax]|uniref:Na+/H+ antiporter MnhB subunit-related protein n=1 Tax=Pseudofrankia inefficax (strain DSM 45817 / CECT 9037 / DDB 130130 / EuI1c) TaxID=298654 RepID=E3J8G8_PSEI1|nr:MnhB domain-containing protein [Pseudofrankia inefficax]ADP84502.1 Na+/H+ antiporter MnhB subunit-related protein [Pseudofrankia inefficax]
MSGEAAGRGRRARLAIFCVGGAGVAVLFGLAVFGLPAPGGDDHPYRDRAVPAAVSHGTANVVSSVNFDLRAMDTLGEEAILFASVLGVAALARPTTGENERRLRAPREQVLDAARATAAVFFPVTLVVGLDVVLHGALTPGGGFQGGVILGTGIHLVYIAGGYRALLRVRPLDVFEHGEAVGMGAFVAAGVAALLVGGSFLGNVVPTGRLGSLTSSGTVELLSLAVGVEVASAVVVLLAAFLTQLLEIGDRPEADQ